MEYRSDQAVEILSRTPSTLKALLNGLPGEWTHSNAGPGTWSAHQVVGHMLDSEQSNWMVRIRFLLEHGQERPFEPLNRMAMLEKYPDYPLDQLLEDFAQARHQNLETLRGLNITSDKLALKGTHPA